MKKPTKEIKTCKICKEDKILSLEHIPPRAAFNKTTKYYSVTQEEYFKTPNLLEFKPKGKIQQGGMKYYCLCEKCNNFLGQNYVRPYTDFVNIGMNIIQNYKFRYIEFVAKEINPLRILKQIASMFISISDPIFTDQYPELLEFVRDTTKTELSDRFYFYLYFNNRGQYRKFGYPTMTYPFGMICELTYPPFGYVLSIDNKINDLRLTDITNFKEYSDNRNHSIKFGLNNLATFIHMPIDYREKNEIPTK